MKNLTSARNLYLGALSKLEEALAINELDDLQLDGIIRRFKITLKFCIEYIKEYSAYEGFVNIIDEPLDILKKAFEIGIIEKPDVWINMFEDMKRITNLYDYHVSKQIFENIKNKYIILFRELKEKLKGEK